VEEVDETYKNFSTRMDKYREKVVVTTCTHHRGHIKWSVVSIFAAV
jgi:hypothetical protein